MLYHVDGELVNESEAVVSVRDRGFAYGDAAFETLRAYGGTCFEWDAHAERLFRSLELLGIDPGLDRDEFRSRVRETLAANDLDEAYVRLSVTRGVQPGKLTPDPEVDPTVVVVLKQLPRGGREGSVPWDDPVQVLTAETRRIPDEAIPARAKTHNYLNGILARLELRGREADEAIMLDGSGYLAEGATSNVFFVADGTLRTPSLDGPVLPGITRSVVLDLAEGEGIPVETGRYEPDEFRAADEAFLTNSTWEVRPVAAVDGESVGGEPVDGEPVGGGPVTNRLQRAYTDLVERRHY